MSLKTTQAEIEKKFGKGHFNKLGEAPWADIEVIPTGCLPVDLALGIKGYARGRLVEIYGPEASGKTTLTLHAIAEAQKLGLTCVFIDAEHALDPNYAAAIGVDIDNLYVSQPDSGEMALEIALRSMESGEVGLIVVDSVAALTPAAEIAGDIGDSHVGLQARMMGQALRKMTAIASKSNTTVIFINQLREKIGVMFGSPETTPGGRALKFYCSQRLDVRRIEAIKDGVEMTGNRTRVKVVKNRMAAPFKQAEFDIMYGKGISQAGSILDLGVEHGLIKKSGAYFYDMETSELIGQGKNKARLMLEENPDILAGYYEKLVT